MPCRLVPNKHLIHHHDWLFHVIKSEPLYFIDQIGVVFTGIDICQFNTRCKSCRSDFNVIMMKFSLKFI